MSVNLMTSRRTKHHKCYYFHRDTSIKDLSEYKTKSKPAGFVRCEDVSPKTMDRNKISDSFMFDESTITLETEDLNDIVQNDVIEYEEDYWRVLNVQRKKISKNEMFMKHPSFTTYIQIKK